MTSCGLVMSVLTKHADHQRLPRIVSKRLLVCPICKKRTKWSIYDKFGFTTRGYKIVCGECEAEWEYLSSDGSTIGKDLLFGPFSALPRIFRIADDNSFWTLRSAGKNNGTEELVDKRMMFSEWKRMAGRFCGQCAAQLADDEDFCPECGVKWD
jgi:formate dehydrogenase maturation protein FdhE